MQNILIRLLSILLFFPAVAFGDVIASWNFNDQNTTVDVGSGTFAHNFAQEANLSYQSGSTLNALPGTVAGMALTLAAGTNSVNNGKYVEFIVSTKTYKDIKFNFTIKRTTTGFVDDYISVAYDDKPFANWPSHFDPTTSFTLQNFDLSAILEVNAKDTVHFRIFFNAATGGSVRLDNVVVSGNCIPIPPVNPIPFVVVKGFTGKAIQTAIDTAIATGMQMVFFPPGTYLVEYPINIRNRGGLLLRGSGYGTQIRGMFPAGNDPATGIPFEKYPVIDLTGSGGITINSLKVGSNTMSSCGILLARPYDLHSSGGHYIEDVSIEGKFAVAPLCIIASEVNTFMDCGFTNILPPAADPTDGRYTMLIANGNYKNMIATPYGFDAQHPLGDTCGLSTTLQMSFYNCHWARYPIHGSNNGQAVNIMLYSTQSVMGNIHFTGGGMSHSGDDDNYLDPLKGGLASVFVWKEGSPGFIRDLVFRDMRCESGPARNFFYLKGFAPTGVTLENNTMACSEAAVITDGDSALGEGYLANWTIRNVQFIAYGLWNWGSTYIKDGITNYKRPIMNVHYLVASTVDFKNIPVDINRTIDPPTASYNAYNLAAQINRQATNSKIITNNFDAVDLPVHPTVPGMRINTFGLTVEALGDLPKRIAFGQNQQRYGPIFNMDVVNYDPRIAPGQPGGPAVGFAFKNGDTLFAKIGTQVKLFVRTNNQWFASDLNP